MLNFPQNPSVGELYQIGSSAEYRFTDKNLWEVVQPSPVLIINSVSSSYAATASYLLNAPEAGASVIISASAPVGESKGRLWFNTETTSGNGGEMYILMDETSSNWIPVHDKFLNTAISSSYAVSSSHSTKSVSANTASYINPLQQAVQITGSVEIAGDLNVVGNATFISVTASNVIVDQNTITVFGSGSNLPRAGFIAADTASVYDSGSFLYNLPVGQWESNAPIVASSFVGTATTASFAINSLTAVSSSHSLRANASLTAVSSSHAIRANSSQTATSSSFATTAVSSSIAARANTTTMGYAAILFNNAGIPSFANGDITPILSRGVGISTSGNTMIIANPGVYSVTANIGIRATFAEYSWVDALNVQLSGTNVGLSLSVNSVEAGVIVPATGIIVTTTPNTVIKLRIRSMLGFNPTQVAGYAGAQIIQIR